MSDRLRLAVENGHVVLPEGPVLVLEPRAETDLSFLDPSQTRVVTRYFTVEKAQEAAGYFADATGKPAAYSILTLPRSRDAQKMALRQASQMAKGPIIVDGNKTDGVDAFYRDVRKRANVSEAWSKAHGKVFSIYEGQFEDWPACQLHRGDDGWWRTFGVFSADGVDKASAFLADNLPRHMDGRVVDLGAGWGYLSKAILDREGVTEVHMVEDDQLALLCAEENTKDDRAKSHWADALTWRPESPVDHVVTNPPFHQGRAADPSLGQAFIRAAAAMLKPKGDLWLVANRHLPYEKTLKDAFRTVELHAENPSFKIFHATSPKRRKV